MSEQEKMEMLVSSSLIGRDVSIIKSIININNMFGSMIFKYEENSKLGSVHISKEEDNQYYAFIKPTKSRLLISPTLNPLTFKDLLQKISEISHVKASVTINQLEPSNLLTQIYEFLISHSNQVIQIRNSDCDYDYNNPSNHQQSPFVYLLINQIDGHVYSHVEIDKSLINKIINNESENYLIEYKHQEDFSNFKYQTSLARFKWDLGMHKKDSVFDEKYTTQDYSFKQVLWPNYGQLPFKKEFIQLSSLLKKNSLSYEYLIKQTEFDEEVIHQFINAGSLSKHLIIVSEKAGENIIIRPNKSGFIASLKSFFSNHVKINKMV